MKNQTFTAEFTAILAAAENDYQQFLASEKTAENFQQFCAAIKTRKNEIKEKAVYFDENDELFHATGAKKQALLTYFGKLERIFCNGEEAYFQEKVKVFNQKYEN